LAVNLGRKIAGGVALGSLNLGLSAVVMLVATPLILRELGDVGYGLNGLMTASFGVLNLLAFGGQEATLYFSSKDGAEAHTRALGLWHLFGACLGLALFWGLGSLLGLGEILGLKAAESSAFDQALAAGGFFWAAQFICNWLWMLCRARLRFGLMNSYQACISVLGPACGLMAAHHFGGLIPFLWAQAAVWWLGALCLLPWMKGLFGKGIAAPWREIWAYARWAMLFSLSFVALQYADRFFVAPFGAAAVAAYTLASSLYQRGISAFGMLPSLLVPAISRMEGEDLSRAKRAYGLSLRLSAVLAMAGFLPLMGLGDAFLGAWLPGHEALVARAFPVLFLLSAAGCLGAMSMILHSVLLGLGRAKQVALTGLAGAALGYAAAALALPALGIEAAAFCGLVGYASIYTLRLVISERRVFGRALLPLAREHALMLAGASLAVFLLRQASPFIRGLPLALVLLALAASALGVALSALAADSAVARLLGRESVAQALQRIAGLAA
jgi:O-antigen/teichoic acid export membrane protein